MSITNFYEHKPDGAPKQIVIMLHGVGSNGEDLIGLAPIFAQALPDAVFVSPDAPFPYDMAPIGYQWFSLYDRGPEAMLAGIKVAAPLLEEFIEDRLQAHNLSADKLVLLGFSQGTMMSLYAGPRLEQDIAGILGYSGALLGGDTLETEAKNKPPIQLVHGDEDDVVPVEASYHAKVTLEQAGFDVDALMVPGIGHGIDESGVAAGVAFLQKVLL